MSPPTVCMTKRRRSHSILEERRHASNGESILVTRPQAIGRTVSCSDLIPARSDARETPRVRIAYIDDFVCANTLENMHRLLRTAKDGRASLDNSSAIAKKALQYRKMLRRAEATNVEDPGFDVAAFMGVKWSKIAN